MSYNITPYTLARARELGLKVTASDKPKYKIKVSDSTGKFLFYGGDPKYKDYPTYLNMHGKEFADNRRRLYRIRHQKEINKVGSRGSIIAFLLW